MFKFRFNIFRCLAIAKKELHHILRDISTLSLICIMPIFMIILFGFAVSGDIKKVPVAIWNKSIEQETPYDKDKDEAYSQELINNINNAETFDVCYMVNSKEEINQLIAERKINIGVIIPPRYSERFHEYQILDNMQRVEVIVDGADPAIARIASETINKIILKFTMGKTDALLSVPTDITQQFEPSAAERGAINQTILKNELMQQKYFLIPSVISLIVFSIIVVLTASTIVREKERGTIEQLMLTPMTKTEFMLGKLIPYIFVGFIDILLIIFLANFLFGVGIAGSLWLFIGIGMIFVLCALGLGILISTFSSNQGQAIMLAILCIIPSLILSGIVVPVSTMPSAVAFLAKLLPLTHFLEISRGIMIKGVGASLLATEIISLTIFAIVVVTLAIIRFKKSLD